MCEHVFELIKDEEVCIHCLDSYKSREENTECCDDPDVEVSEFLLLCRNCGCGEEILNLVPSYESLKTIEHRSNLCYKRLKYFRQKLSLMSMKNISNTNEISTVISNEKIKNCSTIQEIVAVLSKLKKRKFIKNVYEIYYLVHKEKLINFSAVDLYNLETLFIKFEKAVKQQKIKYLNNYNEIIYHLMNKLGLSGSQHILKPRTFKKNENIYKNILATI